MTLPQKNKFGELVFKDYPNFLPNLTPQEIFSMGSFGGTYWRPIKNDNTLEVYKDIHLQYPKEWWKDINENQLTNQWENYDKKINKYGVKVGSTLQEWREKNWITEYHPYGWVQWYCDFYLGKRCPDDDRQIKRWIQTAGPSSRFRKRLINMIHAKNTTFDDYNISPKIRQTLQHWGYILTKKDYLLDKT